MTCDRHVSESPQEWGCGQPPYVELSDGRHTVTEDSFAAAFTLDWTRACLFQFKGLVGSFNKPMRCWMLVRC